MHRLSHFVQANKFIIFVFKNIGQVYSNRPFKTIPINTQIYETMRNCFVPHCDSKYKTKRMMFMPPKNEDVFNTWKDILPKKRVFKKTDRVCERHFNKADISTTWDHVINGVLHQLERGKPKLNPTALPIYNLPTEWGGNDLENENEVEDDKKTRKVSVAKSDAKNGGKGRKATKRTKASDSIEFEDIKIGNHDESPPKLKKPNLCKDSEVEVESVETISIAIVSNEKEHEHDEEKSIMTNDNTNKHKPRVDSEADDSEEGETEESPAFEAIYDDVFEVELPSTMWGIHRDPDRKFIIFSMFDAEMMRSKKVLHVNNRMTTKCYVYNVLLNKQTHSEITIELLTDLLIEINEYRICANYKPAKGSPTTCELLTHEFEDLCANCSQGDVRV